MAKATTFNFESYRTDTPAAVASLRALVERYPYFHAARLLYVRSLHQNHDALFGPELRKAAIRVPDRRTLYRLIEGDGPNPAKLASKPLPKTADGESRTETLISGFLNSVQQPQQRTPRQADATVDYIEFMRAEGQLPTGNAGQGDVIDNFLRGDGKLVLHERDEEEMLKPLADTSTGTDSAVLTEVMAKIYIKQHKYGKALEIIRKLSLKYPKKSRYFADQMRFLEKLIINERNKKG